jgi:gamma-glutamyltranspeptidase/glutathione hydrolase
MGHVVDANQGTWGNLQTVAWDRIADTLEAGSDPRNPAGSGAVMPAQPRAIESAP